MCLYILLCKDLIKYVTHAVTHSFSNLITLAYLYYHCHLVNDVLDDVNVHKNDDDEVHMPNRYNLT